MPPRTGPLGSTSPFTTRAFPKDASSGLPRWDSRGHAEDGRMCVSRKINGHGTGELEGLESCLVTDKLQVQAVAAAVPKPITSVPPSRLQLLSRIPV